MSNKSETTLTAKYGFRTFFVLLILFIFSTFLLIEYFASGQQQPSILALSILFYIIFAILLIGFRLTNVKNIRKRYFHPDSVVGQVGRVTKGVPAGQRGGVQIESEEWSFISDSDTKDNENVEVVRVMEDKVTLKVKKIS
ncbi:MAG: hypothetical protein M1515_03275 [Candidatus Thermoplasmatota archaeon]|jgi:membrane-bound ClpP family serine protease|nr:hypothetical protein [Candidatus Thermoplasmatota archaeon]